MANLTAADFIRNSIRQNNEHDKVSKVTKVPKFPCGICNLDVKHNDKSILCSECDKWAHIHCTEVSIEQYKDMQQRNREFPDLVEAESWLCIKCVMYKRLEFNPFIFLSSNQLTNMNSVNSMKLFDMFPAENVFHDALKTNCLNINDDDVKDDDLDEDLIDQVNCKYFTCDEFFNHDNTNSLNILHSNVNGYLSHADNINEFISHDMRTVFDAICITETSFKENDIEIPDAALPDGYIPYSTGTLSLKGGATIFY